MPPSPVSSAAALEVIDCPWGTLTWHVSAALGNSSAMTFGIATILPGQINPRHRHPNCEEILHVIRGRIEHWLGETSYLLDAGDTISIPANVWHQARALGDEEAVMAISFSSAERDTEFG
jgi:quercetin dioxygenase-like cupin family protein